MTSNQILSSKQVPDQREELLMTEKRKYPEVFKWKIAVIVIVVLTAIILVVDLIMFLYLKNHELRNNNYTFAADLVNLLAGAKITRNEFVNLMGGLTASYTDIWFQRATKVAGWSSQAATMFNLEQAATFFSKKVTDRLTLIRFTDGTKISILGAFTHIPFQLPNQTWKGFLKNQNNSYYNFEIDSKQSTTFGSNSESYLKMDGSSENLANCRIINLNQFNLNFLLGSSIILNSNTNPNKAQLKLLSAAEIPSECFSSSASYNSTVVQIVGDFELGKAYDIIDINAYQLRK